MSWMQLAVYIFQLVFRLWDLADKIVDEKKKKRTEALQDALRGIVDKDTSRINAALDKLSRI